MKSRIFFIFVCLSGVWSILLLRAGYIQLVPDERLQALKRRQFETVVTLSPRRGDILDRRGKELAVSVTTHSLFADPKLIKHPKKVARLLAKKLGLSSRAVERKIQDRHRRFVWIKRHLDKAEQQDIASLRIRGLGFIDESKRVYPNGHLLSHVLGFVSSDGRGLEGIELGYNDLLFAAKKKVNLQRDARGRPLMINGQLFNQTADGMDMQLTIDRDIQFILEQELVGAVTKHRAESAVGIVLEAKTSEILAMASVPSFDPNQPGEFLRGVKRNRAITDSFEPGSTLKTFVVAEALERGEVRPNTVVDCEAGSLKIGRKVIREASANHRFHQLSVSEVLAFSSNIGSARIGLMLGQEGVRASLERFGFGKKTEVDFPGESHGILHALPWRDRQLATVAFGHGMTATPLQVANAYASIANGGWLRRPYIVKGFRDHESGDTEEVSPKTTKRVLSSKSAELMRMILVGSTAFGGTGHLARVPGYPVAGKTGTAQKVDPNGRGYLPGTYISSFVGFLPANDPKFVIYIAVDSPKDEYYGSAVAAPIFSHVAGFAVRRAGLAPVLMRAEVEAAPVGSMVRVGTSRPREAEAMIEELRGSRVPDLTGLSLREALVRLGAMGVRPKVQGRGFVSHTIPPAGTVRMTAVAPIKIFLAPVNEEK